jgi:dCTP deaminase
MLLSDREIRGLAYEGMISPFHSSMIRKKNGHSALSFGMSSYGYDLRLSPKEFFVFHHVPGTVMDPKSFNPDNLRRVKLFTEGNGSYFILPAHHYGLGVAVEKLKMPSNITGVCLGKSTYARLGIIVNTTPAEAGWEGHLTLEFSNSSGADCRIYVNEGVCQMLFLQGAPCSVSYADRSGKYQDQAEEVVFAKV